MVNVSSTWRSLLPLLLAFGAFFAGCRASPTQVVIVVDSDLPRSEADGLEIAVTSPSGVEMVQRVAIDEGDSDWPRSWTQLNETGQSGTFRAEARALLGDSVVVRREAEFEFVPEESRLLTLHLLRACVGVSCPERESCGESGCGAIDARDLPMWDGDEPRIGDVIPDAGTDAAMDSGSDVGADATMDVGLDATDSDACVASEEVCDGVDNDCDSRVDEGFGDSLENCGICGRACEGRGAMWACVEGECAVLGCDVGFADCNANPADGCEADLSRPATCGGCGITCTAPNRDCCDGECGRC